MGNLSQKKKWQKQVILGKAQHLHCPECKIPLASNSGCSADCGGKPLAPTMLESLMTAIANLFSASPGPEAPMDVAFEGWLTKHQKIIGSWRGRIGSNWRKRYFK